MTSRGLSDARRALKDQGTNHSGGPEPWRDNFRGMQEPRIPISTDPLVRFVAARITELETEPSADFPQMYDQPAGPAAHRYAGHVRQDCVAFRKIIERYVRARETADSVVDPSMYDDDADAETHVNSLRGAVLDIASRWSDHRDHRQEWKP